jgi:hypothetical protein
MKRSVRTLGIVAALALGASEAQAQWVSSPVVLAPGYYQVKTKVRYRRFRPVYAAPVVVSPAPAPVVALAPTTVVQPTTFVQSRIIAPAPLVPTYLVPPATVVQTQTLILP